MNNNFSPHSSTKERGASARKLLTRLFFLFTIAFSIFGLCSFSLDNILPNVSKSGTATPSLLGRVGVESETIKWYTFQEAVELNKKNPKKIFIDVYTEWCGWCKKMDASTFKDEKIVKLMNKYYYAVKLDAEMKDTIKFQDHVFVNPNPASNRSPHQLAAALLNNQMSYPTVVFLDEKTNPFPPVPGYQTVEGLEPILIFLGENIYNTTKWEDYIKTFKPGAK